MGKKLVKGDFPSKLYHISTLKPDEFLDGKIKSFENDTIEGERVNAIWASDVADNSMNPYIARDEFGMIRLGEYVFYGHNNMYSVDGRLNLITPLYQYEFDSEGFEKIENNGTVEYIKRDGEIDISDTKCTVIEDITDLCNNYQIFSVNSDEPVGVKVMDIYRQNGYMAAVAYVNDKIADGSLLYRNAEVGVNVNPAFVKSEPVVETAEPVEDKKSLSDTYDMTITQANAIVKNAVKDTGVDFKF